MITIECFIVTLSTERPPFKSKGTVTRKLLKPPMVFYAHYSADPLLTVTRYATIVRMFQPNIVVFAYGFEEKIVKT
jgi:hypothetical protein